MALTKDAHRLSTKCQCMRFILVDEISMVSAQLFGQLELTVSKVVRRRNLFKRRPDDGTSRPFGGMNVIMFGDWWQLKPVSGTALFSDPALASSGVTAQGLQLLWENHQMSCTSAGTSSTHSAALIRGSMQLWANAGGATYPMLLIICLMDSPVLLQFVCLRRQARHRAARALELAGRWVLPALGAAFPRAREVWNGIAQRRMLSVQGRAAAAQACARFCCTAHGASE